MLAIQENILQKTRDALAEDEGNVRRYNRDGRYAELLYHEERYERGGGLIEAANQGCPLCSQLLSWETRCHKIPEKDASALGQLLRSCRVRWEIWAHPAPHPAQLIFVTRSAAFPDEGQSAVSLELDMIPTYDKH